MSNIDEIGKIIGWYHKQYQGAPIEQYMDAKSKLLTLLWTFAGEVADARIKADGAELDRKQTFHEYKNALIEGGLSGVAAESKAELYVGNKREKEIEAGAIFFKSKQLLDIAIKVAEDMTQRISVLRKEKESN